MAMMPTMLSASLVSVKGRPRLAASKVSMGIFVVDQAPIRMNTFIRLLPFFSIIPATGKAAYNGPAAADGGKPSPRLLAPNERRRAPGTVAVALEVALAACEAAGRDPAAVGARILAGKMLDMLEAVDAETADDFSAAVARLRKGETEAAKVELYKERNDLARQSLALERSKFKRLTCEMFIKWYADKKVVAIMDDASSDNDQKTEALGRTLFGDLWSN